jgi:hypothetical protein
MLEKESFRCIRSYAGSQQGGFEELVCQLAHLEPPLGANHFIRKEGSGGDAGVECFWIMEDGSEHAWQAKYFLDSITTSRWAQIDESVNAAIRKHPKLTKYYVCVPVNRTDTRSSGPGGRKKISVLDEWNKHLEKWTKLARSRKMKVEFVYWGAHEILSPLQSSDPKYAGRALYWLNSLVLTTEKLAHCLSKQETTLGERYTPKFHVDLPIASTLEGLANRTSFWDKLNQKAIKWSQDFSSFRSEKAPDDLINKFRTLIAYLCDYKQIIDKIIFSRDRDRLIEIQRALDDAMSKLLEFERVCQSSEEATKKNEHHTSSFQEKVFQFANFKTAELSYFFSSDFVNANVASAVLVVGEAGAGKSHLLCDFAKSHSSAILLLGQHYSGGNPLAGLLDVLDLNQHPYEIVLGAIDAIGEAAKAKAIIIIDAINEGKYRDEWRERLVGLIKDVKRFSHIGLLISCRSRFDKFLIPEKIEPTELLKIEHLGFRGHEHKAASVYLSKQGIAKPTAPITAPEFSNPLFLKTCATALKQLGETSWPKGHQGTSRLFEIYLSSLETVVSKKRRTELNDQLCRKALEAVASAMFPDHLFGLPWDKATQIVNAIDTCVDPDESLLQTLLREGALADDIGYNDDDNSVPKPIVRFSYERFCDHFVAKFLLRDVENPVKLFELEHPLGRHISENSWRYQGILETLSVIIPEQFEVEMWDLLPEKVNSHPQSADFYFFEGLKFRAPNSFTDRTRELFNLLRIWQSGYQDRKLDLLIQFATEPEHPWNANRLHKWLAGMNMPVRDSRWSIYLAKNDYEEDEDQHESAIRSIIEWATFADLTSLEEDCAFLALVTTIWFTTTSNRRTRDQATKGAARLFARHPELIVKVLSQFRDIDDPYLQERLYASVYGGLCNTIQTESLKKTTRYVFETQFKNYFPFPHILLRDYARGMIELARVRGCLDDSVELQKCRPPYRSNWPLNIPPITEVNHYGNAIENSIFHGDFGRYRMGAVEKWSSTELVKSKPESVFEADQTKRDMSDKDKTSELIASVDKEWQKRTLAKFSRSDAMRWVSKRAIELGWTKDLFEKFEKSLRYESRSRPSIERIGKKYQRIAYHELLAHLADNLHYVAGHDYSNSNTKSYYAGPWQPWQRDIDPTHWLRETSDDGWSEWDVNIWWRPIGYTFAYASDNAKLDWCKSPKNLPDFKDLIKTSDPAGNKWYSLRGFSQWREREVSGDDSRLTRDIWFRINSLLVTRRRFNRLKEELKDKDYISPDLVHTPSTHHQTFLREYPWHQSVSVKDSFGNKESWEIETPHVIPYAEYEWEMGSGDESTSMNINLYLPSPYLISHLDLVSDLVNFEQWRNFGGEKIFFDPSIKDSGPRFALVNSTSLDEMLKSEGMILVWLIGGEKSLTDKTDRPVKERMVFNSMAWTDGKGEILNVSNQYME